MIKDIKRGEIYLAELDGKGHEHHGQVPVLIIQNDRGNLVSPTTIVAVMSKDVGFLPTHFTHKDIDRVSSIKCEHIRTIDKVRLKKRLGELPNEVMERVSEKIVLSLALRFNLRGV